jgi:hypothetical protein
MGQNLTAQTGIKSIQRGVISGSSNSTFTATISSVNTSKTELRFLGVTSNMSGAYARIELTNSTTITATIFTGSTAVVNWELTEFY